MHAGETQSLYILTKYNNQRFEFIFTALGTSTDRLFNAAQSIFKAYDASRLYRDLKLRGTGAHTTPHHAIPQHAAPHHTAPHHACAPHRTQRALQRPAACLAPLSPSRTRLDGTA